MDKIIIKDLVKKLVLGNLGVRKKAFKILESEAAGHHIFLTSANRLYKQRQKNLKQYVLPAINLRGLIFELAQAVFSAAKQHKTESFIFEIARSELGYTGQHPISFSGCILAAAIKSDWEGPVYLQADHLQFNPSRWGHSNLAEEHAVKKLIKSYIKAGFCSIDIDCSSLNNLKGNTPEEVLTRNSEMTDKLVNYLSLVGKGKKLAAGVEVGEIGTRNTTVEELNWFLDRVVKPARIYPQIAKVAVQTGTRHGGEISKEGKVQKMTVDFELLKKLNQEAVKHGLYGVVQHGASTLTLDQLSQLPATGILEVHLATGFQNLVFDHPEFPKELTGKINAYLEKEFIDKKTKYAGDEQFLYETRKNTWGYFRKDFLELPVPVKAAIMTAMEEKISEIFKALKII